MSREITLIWDFHGGDSKGMAEHHVTHLKEFMVREKFETLNAFVQSNAEQHCMACLGVHEKDVFTLRDALEPHRAVVEAET